MSAATPAQTWLTCSRCKDLKPAEQFHFHRRTKSGRGSACKPCLNASQRARRALVPKPPRSSLSPDELEAKRAYGRKMQREFRKSPVGKVHVRNMNLKKYGLTAAGYDVMLESQGGVCASCGGPETGRNQFGPLQLAVDHDHETNMVRGLLCMRCNRALGMLGDSAETVESLARYRRRYL